jgi:uncharacterized membrane protein
MPRAKKRVKREIPSREDDDKLFAFLATFFTIVGFIIVIVLKKKSDYVKFYAKQGLVVFIASLAVGIVGWIVFWIPILGQIIRVGLSIVILVLWVLSWVYALSGKKKEVPIIGEYAQKLDF